MSDARIKLIKKINGGVSSARNEGILAAKGEYIAFLDGDDLWHPLYLETLNQLINDFPNAAIYGIGYDRINNDKIIEPITSEVTRGVIHNIWDNYPHVWTGSSSSSSKQRLIDVGLFDTRMTHGEDLDMWWRLLLTGEGVYDSRVLAFYRQETENRAMNKVIPLEKHIPYYMDKYKKYRDEDVDFRRFFDLMMLYRLYPYCFEKKYKKDIKKLLNQIDFSLQKRSMRWRFYFPYIYKWFRTIKGIKEE